MEKNLKKNIYIIYEYIIYIYKMESLFCTLETNATL